MNPSLELTAIAILFAFVFHTLLSLKRKNHQPPEPAGAWPIIGHLYQLLGGSGHQLFHRKLSAMADECGPLFTVRLGSRRAFVVSSWEVAKDCFTVNDQALSSRPETSCVKHMCYDNSMFGFAPYGPLWRDIRKFTKVGLLSSHRIVSLRDVMESEIDTAIKDLYNFWDKNSSPKPLLVDLQKWLKHLTLNVIVRAVAGKRYPQVDHYEARQLDKGVAEFFRLYGISMVADELPGILRWLDVLGLERAMKKSAKELDEIMEGWVLQHRQRRRVLGHQSKAESDEDFIDVMLSLEEEGKLSSFGFESNTLIKSTILEMILGGHDTTTYTLIWAISLLLNNRHMLQKAQNELDLHIELERLVNESDMKYLSHLQAIIKETFRFCPSAPLSAPREAEEDCTIAGFDVPSGALVLFNLWKIHRDPKVWDNPLKFIPERFLTQHAYVDPRSYNSELVVFGGGRRACPGSLFAMQMLHLTLARFIQAFEMTTPLDLLVDLSEGPGLTVVKATPLEVLVTPRLAAKLYGAQ